MVTDEKQVRACDDSRLKVAEAWKRYRDEVVPEYSLFKQQDAERRLVEGQMGELLAARYKTGWEQQEAKIAAHKAAATAVDDISTTSLALEAARKHRDAATAEKQALDALIEHLDSAVKNSEYLLKNPTPFSLQLRKDLVTQVEVVKEENHAIMSDSQMTIDSTFQLAETAHLHAQQSAAACARVAGP